MQKSQVSWLICLPLVICLCVPTKAQNAKQTDQDAGNTKVLWTTEPVRVDRKNQKLPRAPDRRLSEPFPDHIYIPKSVRVSDSTTFQVGDDIFRLAFLEPIPPQKVCKTEEGRRWSCGLRARTNLRAMIAGKQIKCRQTGQTEQGVPLVNCEVHFGVTLAEDLLRSGSATMTPDAPVELTKASTFGVETRAGIWSDAEFLNANGGRRQ
ncbi:hypothetical protein [uncultured Roseibium sp.]|uniref:hypothetical protein n=1 Tax=uncultured Roseibium sp. TaxID=1936171 RepID=UPI003217B98F